MDEDQPGPSARELHASQAFDESMGADAAAREADAARRAMEKLRTQLRTQQAEKSKSERELRAVRGKIDSLKGSLEMALAAKQEVEAELAVHQAAGQAMLQRLQARTAECATTQQQLSVRAVELLKWREEAAFTRVVSELLLAELRDAEAFADETVAFMSYRRASSQHACVRQQQTPSAVSTLRPTQKRAASPPPPQTPPPTSTKSEASGGGGVEFGRSPERARPLCGGTPNACSAEARARPVRPRSPAPR